MAKKSVPISNDFCPQTLFLYGTYTSGGKANFGLFCWFSYCYDKELGVYSGTKSALPMAVEKGRVLDVPTLKDSPVTFELEAVRSMETDGGEVFLCKIRNVLMDESLLDDQKGIEERMRGIAPLRTTCMTYFGWNGQSLGAWGAPKDVSFS